MMSCRCIKAERRRLDSTRFADSPTLGWHSIELNDSCACLTEFTIKHSGHSTRTHKRCARSNDGGGRRILGTDESPPAPLVFSDVLQLQQRNRWMGRQPMSGCVQLANWMTNTRTDGGNKGVVGGGALALRRNEKRERRRPNQKHSCVCAVRVNIRFAMSPAPATPESAAQQQQRQQTTTTNTTTTARVKYTNKIWLLLLAGLVWWPCRAHVCVCVCERTSD